VPCFHEIEISKESCLALLLNNSIITKKVGYKYAKNLRANKKLHKVNFKHLKNAIGRFVENFRNRLLTSLFRISKRLVKNL